MRQVNMVYKCGLLLEMILFNHASRAAQSISTRVRSMVGWYMALNTGVYLLLWHGAISMLFSGSGLIVFILQSYCLYFMVIGSGV